jgi:hypothetical protein
MALGRFHGADVSGYASSGFTDVARDSAALPYIAWAAVKAIQQTGVVGGKPGKRFDPQGSATRAEANAILRRFVELVIDEGAARGRVQNDSGQSSTSLPISLKLGGLRTKAFQWQSCDWRALYVESLWSGGATRYCPGSSFF